MEIVFRTDETEEEEEKKNVFVKIPLTGEAGKNFKQVISSPEHFTLLAANFPRKIHFCLLSEVYIASQNTETFPLPKKVLGLTWSI